MAVCEHRHSFSLSLDCRLRIYLYLCGVSIHNEKFTKMKRTEIVETIRHIIQRVAPGAKTILYGSEARGEARPDSDIDLLILLEEPRLTPEREQEIIRPLYELEVKTGVIISPMIMLRRLWESRPFQTPFSINVTNEGIVL